MTSQDTDTKLEKVRQHLLRYFSRRLPADAAEDAVQDAFLRTAGAQADATNLYYMFRVARAVTADYYRRQKPADAELDILSGSAPVCSLRAQIEEGLATLPRKHRTTAALSAAGYTVREIARMTSSSPTTIHRRLQEARSHLESYV